MKVQDVFAVMVEWEEEIVGNGSSKGTIFARLATTNDCAKKFIQEEIENLKKEIPNEVSDRHFEFNPKCLKENILNDKINVSYIDEGLVLIYKLSIKKMPLEDDCGLMERVIDSCCYGELKIYKHVDEDKETYFEFVTSNGGSIGVIYGDDEMLNEMTDTQIIEELNLNLSL